MTPTEASAVQKRKGSSFLLTLLFTISLALGLFSLWNPLHTKSTSLVFLAALAVVTGLGMVWLKRHFAKGFMAACVLVVLGLGVLLLPGREADKEVLRSAVLRQMKAYEGCTYFWGGENARGIDCSGLIRRGMINACWEVGVTQLNPKLIRRALQLWWRDTTAERFGDLTAGLTEGISEASNLKDLVTDDLKLGDLAVTRSGNHILAYMGENRWIQADPGVGKVLILNAQTDKNGWFANPMRLVRWKWL